ncbi:hypothetical protein H2203_008807 [Taxawa tesnikishii (nom. ined.)]|nr:hypothetical protein H2203_008807 [Dothideales sp. JES 119]
MNESFQEDGPARKRAKITQSEWRGKSSFGTNSADLRVTASTAASIRIHKPVATRPGIASSSLEPPPRVPTPVPQKTGQAMGRSRSQAGNFLRRESSLANVQSYSSRYEPGQHTNNNPEVVMSSPEEDQMDETTPPELPSSPPAMPATSSPGLPTINSHMDSGYMSGSLLECQNDDEDRSPDAEDLELMVQYSARSQVLHPDISFNTINNIHADKTMKHRTPGPPENLPTRMDMAGAHKDKNGSNQAELSRQKATSAVTRRGSLALPQKPSVSQTTAQSQSTSQDQQTSGSFHKPTLNKSSSTATARSEAASPAPSEGPEAGTQRSGSGAKRRKYVESQLKQAIESGEMPTYCAHCGAIETPTWRNIFVKTMEGNPQDHVIREVEGITLAVEYIDTDPETNMVTKFRIIKSSKKARNLVETEGFDMLFVCNPCGLWFNKYKTMRPPEKWNKQSKPRKWKRNNTGLQRGSQQDADEHTEAAPARTDRPRATSMQPEKRPTDTQNRWTGADLDAALHRAIQSSPARFLGTQESPIELDTDLTPRPTRRILFPSPRKEGEVRTLDDSALPTLKEALNKGNAGAVHCTSTFNDEDNLDKENLPPPVDADDDLAHLFEGSPNGLLFKTPAKVTPTKRTPRSQQNQFDDLLKTPTPSHTRASLLCSPNANAFLPTFSPAETRNLPMTPSRNTVGSSPRGQMTPFTRHLTQLLSDTNENALLSSPGRPFDFSDLPTFLTPGRTLDFDFGDAEAMGIFSDVVEGVKEDEKVVGEGGGVEGERV